MGRIVRLPLALVPRERPVRILAGPLRGARWIPGSGVHGYWLGRFEREEVALFTSLVGPGDSVFDVGAHVGYYALFAARLTGATGHVVAFEPLPRNLRYLRRHVELNRCSTVRVVPAAVADAAGEATFQEGGTPSEGALASDGTIRVDVVTLDAVAYGGATPVVPALLKIDVEGAEHLALRGAGQLLTQARPDILLSTHTVEARSECRAILARHDYDVRPMASAHHPAELFATARGSRTGRRQRPAAL